MIPVYLQHACTHAQYRTYHQPREQEVFLFPCYHSPAVGKQNDACPFAVPMEVEIHRHFVASTNFFALPFRFVFFSFLNLTFLASSISFLVFNVMMAQVVLCKNISLTFTNPLIILQHDQLNIFMPEARPVNVALALLATLQCTVS